MVILMYEIAICAATAVIGLPLYVYLSGLVIEKLSANHVSTQKTTVALLGNAQELQDKQA